MNTKEMKQIIAMIKGAYPRLDFDTEKIKVWFMFLAGKPYKRCIKNLTYHIENNPFPPSIADVVNNKEVREIEKERVIERSRTLDAERNKWVDKHGTIDGFEQYWNDEFEPKFRG